jgi:hypothetical protein
VQSEPGMPSRTSAEHGRLRGDWAPHRRRVSSAATLKDDRTHAIISGEVRPLLGFSDNEHRLEDQASLPPVRECPIS